MTVIPEKMTRQEQIDALIERDGLVCQHPKCGEPLDLTRGDENDPFRVTIDHWMPQHYGKANNWTYEEIWALSNLRLMHKRCNAKKGDLIPNEDGTLPEKATRKFRYRRQKRAERPEICTACNAGRNLGPDEWCNSCGGGGATDWWKQKWRQMTPKECDHDNFYCVACTVWFPEYRRSVLDTLVFGGEGYEDAE